MKTQWITAIALVILGLAGCADADDETDAPAPPEEGPDLTEISPGVFLAPVNVSFLAHVIDIAVHTGHGLYEPTIDVSPEGAIYVSAHSTGVGVLPAPAYVSTDDGASWRNMATAAAAVVPAPGQTAGGPLSDEIFIVAGEDGQAWGVDINLHSYIVQGWCDDGATNCYYNPQAYDHAAAAHEGNDCTPVPLKDRPWAAYSNGWLLLVNNPGGGPAQIGAMRVPPTLPADVGPVASDIEWNLCADSGGGIPGIPDLRPDGFFAVAHQQGGRYVATVGNITDIRATQERFVFNNTHTAPSESDSGPSQIGRYGQAAFDATGALWFGAMNNTQGAAKGGIHIALSTDDAETFTDRIFRFDQPVSSIYLDGNRFGPGALVNWGQIDGAHTDWYFGHLVVDEQGEIELTNVMLAFDDGPEASRHVQGAALGPDGRAYMVMSDVSGNDSQAMAEAVGSTPMRVVVQQDGPTLPVNTTAAS